MNPACKTVVGLEVHVQLQTDSKLFCGCSTRFGAPPNSQTCPVCIGMPGVLPVLNEKAIVYSIKTGLALHCQIAQQTNWDRKNYFYPDLPKGYQISQLDRPVCGEGYLELPKKDDDANEPVRIRIQRAHLEEDAGKSIHVHGSEGSMTHVDLNRAGTPLLEIVTFPDLESGAQAKSFLTELKLILQYLGVSNCNMQQGSLRVDANVNLHIGDGPSPVATPIVEIKNLNSFRAVERALDYEAQRQLETWQATGQTIDDAPKQTRGWDDESQLTFPQRQKELSADYRYFPEPDLPLLQLAGSLIEQIEKSIPELPESIRQRLRSTWQVSAYDANVIVAQGQSFVSYFESLARAVGDGKLAANWLTQEILRYLNEHQLAISDFPVPSAEVTRLLQEVQQRRLDTSRAKNVLAEMIASGSGMNQARERLGIKEVDAASLESLCRELLDENPAVVADYLGGNTKSVGALIGAAKKREPNINPGQIREMLIAAIESRR